MSSPLIEAIERALTADHPAVQVGATRALLMADLPSGARIALDATGHYSIVPVGAADPVVFAPECEQRFVDVLELDRREFEDQLEKAARAADLPIDDAVLAFPAIALMRAVLALGNGYTSRLALRWLLPSERSELRPTIAVAAKNGDLPQDVRDLARHLAR